ncbi:PA14 domain-containing protein [Nocardia pseudobrasiliensis]|uniref:PA14 domain-containing protein n=1 Tax=Nocardia pseudobrasiliensis TaxID=45979 RepID=UPI001471972F|nr:PA14 domain-containing protein [Nocardia pseudobrasiliensis]
MAVALVATMTQVIVSHLSSPKSPVVPLLSPVSGPTLDTSPAPAADFAPLAGAGGTRASFDPKTSKESGRSERSVEYTNSSGTRSVALSPSPVSVPDSRGGWASPDTRVTEGKNSKAATSVIAGGSVGFAESGDDSSLVRIDRNGTAVTMALQGATKSHRTAADSTVTYADVLAGTDLTYTLSQGEVKESLIVKSPTGVGEGQWVFRMSAGALTPKVQGDTVVLTDASGAVVAGLPPVSVWDSPAAGKSPARAGGAYALARQGDSWSLTVSVDKKWLTDKARRFPITIDPTYTYGFDKQPSTIAFRSDGSAGCESTCGIAIGNSRPNNQNLLWRSGFRFDFTPVAGKMVVGARLDFQRTGTDGTSKSFTSTVSKAGSPLGFGAVGEALASGPIGDGGTMQSKALTEFVAGRVAANDTNAWFMLAGSETDEVSYKQLRVRLIVDYGTAAPESAMVGPVDDAVLSTLTPTLQSSAVSNPSGDATQYCFKISTGVDGRSGSVVDSGCLDAPSWTVPRYVLHDGGRYTWTVDTAIKGGVTTTPAHWVGHFRVDQRIGAPGPVPTDTIGPVQVNLFNGNAHTEVSGPGFTAVGGNAGVKFTYNSQAGEAHGMRASYFNDSRHNGTPDDAPVLVRGESQVNLNWSTPLTNPNGSLVPGAWESRTRPPALAPDWYVIRWEGYFQAEDPGNYQFTGAHIDGAKIWVNDKLIYDHPDRFNIDQIKTGLDGWTDAIALKQNQRVPVKVELYHRSLDPGVMQLWVRPDPVRSKIAETESLFPQDVSPLPPGWQLAAPASGYTHAELLDGAVVLTDTAGGAHSWARTAGGYAPPPDEDGVLAFDANGRISVTENGVVSLFNPDGTLAAVSTVLDSKKPAALQYVYAGTPPRLTQIKDPVSGRSHTLSYNIDNSDSCYGGATKPQGATSAPQGKLCRIIYWDGTETRLWYDRLTLQRIENPGGVQSDFAYLRILEKKECRPNPQKGKPDICNTVDPIEDRDGPHGPITKIRSPLGNDWIAAQPPFSLHSEAVTDIGYALMPDIPGDENSEREQRYRVAKVQLPAIGGFGQIPTREQRTYGYDFPHKQAAMQVAGLNPKIGFARKVTWDDAGRALVSTDGTGISTSAEWNPKKDLPLAVVDAAGRRSTIGYDHADRPTDKYGPAPASCFTGQTPTAACAGAMPHSHTNYDQGLTGLQAQFYDNRFLSGVPKVWATGVGPADGALSGAWGSAPPVPNSDGWSGRFTGEIQFPAPGDYGVGFTVVDGVRLWLDDVLLVDSWTDKASLAVPGKYTNAVAGSWHRLRVDYYNRSGTSGALNFTWTPPGVSTPVTVPGQNLAPSYGLATGSLAEDTSGGSVERAPSGHTATSFSDPGAGVDPVFGLAVSTTADPGGLNLTARHSYEKPGDGYLRSLAGALPAGDIGSVDKRSTTTYYGDRETRANPCDAKAPAANQAGLAKTVTGAKPVDGPALVGESVYDNTGRVVASRIGDGGWVCISYDARGRVAKQIFPAFGGKPARTLTYDYAVGGDPLTTKVIDDSGTLTTVTDLNGRIVHSTDASGVVSDATYDQAGRVTKNVVTVKGTTSTSTYAWDDASRLTAQTLDGNTIATPGYTNAGELANVAYGNGSRLDALDRNASGSPTALTWQASQSTVVDAVTRSRSNRITDDVVTADGKPVAFYAYTYDSVGRLVAATVPHHQLSYAFDGGNGCGPAQSAGHNTNRTSFTDVLDGGAPAVTTYCYDNADRLLSTNGATTLAVAYDTHGDAIKVGGDELGYDATKRHISTKNAAGTLISYSYDPAGRLITRTVTGATKPEQNGTAHYGYSSGAASPDVVLDSSGAMLQRILGLPGGVLLTKTYTQPAQGFPAARAAATPSTSAPSAIPATPTAAPSTSTPHPPQTAAPSSAVPTKTPGPHASASATTHPQAPAPPSRTTLVAPSPTSSATTTAHTSSTSVTPAAKPVIARDQLPATSISTPTTTASPTSPAPTKTEPTGTSGAPSPSVKTPSASSSAPARHMQAPTPGQTNWSYPNIHGDVLFTADGTAARSAAIYLYDPYGQNIDPATGAIGDIPIPSTAEGGMDFGWLGQHQLPIEHLAGAQAIEMGARTYLPVLGRFLQVDPVAGGSANDYDYANADPINNTDFTGKQPDRPERPESKIHTRLVDQWGDSVPYRVGFWDPTANNLEGAGFGHTKVVGKHNLLDDSVVGVTLAYPGTSEQQTPTRWAFRKEWARQIKDRRTGQWVTVESVWVRVVVDYAKLKDDPEAGEVGVVTAHCEGSTRCPDWINNLPQGVPQDLPHGGQ